MLKLLFLYWLTLLPGQVQPDSDERIILQRIEYIYNLKTSIDKVTWKGFADHKFDLPLVYYTDSACYVANPTEKFIASYKPDLVAGNITLKIFKTKRIDSIPFHMETSMTFGENSSAYNYKSPFMNCSSFEITRKTVPGVNSTEQWATMIIHEYFHGFQFKHPAHMEYFEKHIYVSSDTLNKLYKSHPWFKESIDKENAALLSALVTNDERQLQLQVDSFFLLRAQRRQEALQRLNSDIAQIEQTYETMEGTARYVEYSLYQNFAKKQPNDHLQKNDSSYHSYQYFRNSRMENEQWLYLSDKTAYFYATGFNLVRLMDKLKIDYKTRLFSNGGLSLEQLLKQNREHKTQVHK